MQYLKQQLKQLRVLKGVSESISRFLFNAT